MRHAVTAALFLCLASIAPDVFAVPPSAATAPTPAASSAPPTAPKLSPADQKRVTAIQQYQHDLVTVVALRAEPDYLLGAAILAKPFENSTAGLDFDTLSARAASATGAGPATHWERLVACKTKEDCPNAEALAWLEQHDPDNAAVWIVAMDVAAANNDSEAERAALKKAAAAQTYDDYYGKALAGVAKAVAVLPPLDETTRGAHSGQPDNPDGVRVLVTVMNMQGYIRPGFGPVDKLCRKDAVDKDADLEADCLALAHTLQWGSSPLARAMGLRMPGELKGTDTTGEQQASRNLQWQVHQYSRLLQQALVDPTLASNWLATARNGGTELSLILATLRANQVSLDAPADASTPAGVGSGGQ